MLKPTTNHISFPLRLILVIALLAGVLLIFTTPIGEASSGDTALYFDGIDDTVQLGPDDGVDEVLGNDWRNNMSISIWMRPLGEPEVSSVTTLPPIVTSNPRWFGITRGVASGTDAIWIFNSGFDGTSAVISQIPIPYTVGEWVHITLVHETDTVNQTNKLYAYKNGVLIGSVNTIVTGGGSGQEVSLGGSYQGGFQNWANVEIDEVALWNSPLTAAQIRAWMNREIDPNDASVSSILQSYYKLNDGTGTIVTDVGPAPTYDGFFYTTLSPTSQPIWTTSGALAGPRNALGFDGTNEYVSISDSAELDMSSDMTLELFVNPNTWSNPSGLTTSFISKGDGSTPELNYYAGMTDSGALMFSYYNTGMVNVIDNSGTTFTDGSWYHLAYVIDSTNNTVSFYSNGELLSTIANDFENTPLVTNNTPLYLGQYPAASGHALFAGKMDEVRIWNTARSASEIRQNMFHPLRGTENGLVVYYRFDQYGHASQTIVYDLALPRNNGVLNNMEGASDWIASTAYNTWIGADSAMWGSASNWSRNTVPVATDNVSLPGYPLTHMTTIDAAVSVNNIVISNATLRVELSGSLSFNNMDKFNPAFQRIQSLPVNSTTVTFFTPDNEPALSINSGVQNLGNTLVTIYTNQECTNYPGDTEVKRCFEITPETLPVDPVEVTFYYDPLEDPDGAINCSSLQIHHWNSGTFDWESIASTTRNCSTPPYSITASIDQFSTFVLDDPPSPTAITLNVFTAQSAGKKGLLDIAILLVFSVILLIVIGKGKSFSQFFKH